MNTIADNINRLHSSLPAGVELVAVSKFHPVEALLEAYDAGQRVFGESRAQEFVAKVKELPGDIRWHFIGHLQTNKVRSVVPHTSLIHSVDSERLLRAIEAEGVRRGIQVDVLVQVHVAREETKTGFTPDELFALVTPELVASLTSVRITGVMGMASNVSDKERIRTDFRDIRACFDRLKAEVFADRPEFAVVSMGMSHDWRIAVEEGSNMVRVGTNIFGQREY